MLLNEGWSFVSDDIFKQTIPVLKTKRLTLRPITLNDVEAMFHYASSEHVARYVTWEPHTSLDDTKKFIEFILNGYKQGNHLI
jgi:[ribosomal protein S5]-alanine N-acetyltransferase